MTGPRVGPRRSEVVSTALVLLLLAVAVFALWPDAPASRSDPATSASPAAPAAPAAPGPAAVAVPDAELDPLRAAAGLDPCPAGTGAPVAGPLVGISATCLGAPGRVDLGAALAGRPALLNLWATWCAPCREELPVLVEYASRPDAVPVLGIDVRDDPRAALALLAELDVRLPSVVDADGSVSAALDAPPALPLSYVVRADGTATRVDPPIPFRTPDEVATAVARLR